jgi:hypothetical protein
MARKKRLPPLLAEDAAETASFMYDAEQFKLRAVLLWNCASAGAFDGPLREVFAGIEADRVRRQCIAELHMTAVHSTESLFAFLRAIHLQGQHFWYELTEYSHEELNSFIKTVREKGIEGLGTPDHPDAIRSLLYPGASDADYARTELQQTAAFARQYLKKLAEFFNDRSDYNAYKHGGRVAVVKSAIQIKHPDGRTSSSAEEDRLLFIDREDATETEDARFVIRMKRLEPERSLNIVEANTLLLKTASTAYSSKTLREQRMSVPVLEVVGAMTPEQLADEIFEKGPPNGGDFSVTDMRFGLSRRRGEHDGRV